MGGGGWGQTTCRACFLDFFADGAVSSLHIPACFLVRGHVSQPLHLLGRGYGGVVYVGGGGTRGLGEEFLQLFCRVEDLGTSLADELLPFVFT
jgi:hypothetical protein